MKTLWRAAKLAQRVLKPGGSLITIIGHYALFKIGRPAEKLREEAAENVDESEEAAEPV